MNIDAEFDALLEALVDETLPALMQEFDRRVYGRFDVEPIVAATCGDWESGDTIGYVVRGKHVADGALRDAVAWDLGFVRFERDELERIPVRRCWGRLEPWSIAFPGEECEGMGDDEPEVWQWYDRPVAFSEPVTIIEVG